jgi:hypothetical protein
MIRPGRLSPTIPLLALTLLVAVEGPARSAIAVLVKHVASSRGETRSEERSEEGTERASEVAHLSHRSLRKRIGGEPARAELLVARRLADHAHAHSFTPVELPVPPFCKREAIGLPLRC